MAIDTLYSIVNYTGNGTTKSFTVPFPYLYVNDVHLLVDDEEVSVYPVISHDNPPAGYGAHWYSSNTIRFVTAPASGVNITIQRMTNRAEPEVEFENSAILTEEDLNLIATQLIYIVQEAYDHFSLSYDDALAIINSAKNDAITAKEAAIDAKNVAITTKEEAEAAKQAAESASEAAEEAAANLADAVEAAQTAAEAATSAAESVDGVVEAAEAAAEAAIAAAAESESGIKTWDEEDYYQPGSVVRGSDGGVYVALQSSGGATDPVDPVDDSTIAWARVDLFTLQNWIKIGTYALTPVEGATYNLTTSQGMCYDTTRNRFVVAIYAPGETNQELHALDPSDFSIVTAAAHTDLAHANSLTYFPVTDEIVCTTGITETEGGVDKKVLVVVDAATLTTQRKIYMPLPEKHLAYDPVKGIFVMALQSSSATPPWQFERFWTYDPVVTNGALTGLSLIETFDVPLPRTGMHNNGLGCYDGIAFVGGSYWSIIDYENKRLINSAPSSQASAEFEDFVYINASYETGLTPGWYCNTNVAYTIFRFNPAMKSHYSMDRYKAMFDSVLDGDLKITTGNVIHTGRSNTGALRFYASRNGISDGGQVFICGNGFGGTTDRGSVRLMASSPDGTNNCGVQVRVIEEDSPVTYKKAFFPWVTNTTSLGLSSRLWTEVFAATGTINTSDERQKDNITTFPDAVLDAWGEVGWCQFQMRDAIAEKGDAARLHSGIIAQRIASIFEAHGLDASRYGLFCHDVWGAEYDRLGYVVLEAGDAYSIRYAEALAMEAAYQRRRADRAEARITNLEQRLDELEQVISTLGNNSNVDE